MSCIPGPGSAKGPLHMPSGLLMVQYSDDWVVVCMTAVGAGRNLMHYYWCTVYRPLSMGRCPRGVGFRACQFCLALGSIALYFCSSLHPMVLFSLCMSLHIFFLFCDVDDALRRPMFVWLTPPACPALMAGSAAVVHVRAACSGPLTS